MGVMCVTISPRRRSFGNREPQKRCTGDVRFCSLWHSDKLTKDKYDVVIGILAVNLAQC